MTDIMPLWSPGRSPWICRRTSVGAETSASIWFSLKNKKTKTKIKWKFKGSVQAQVRPWDAAYVYEALWTGRSKILFYICPILNATFISSSSTETHHFHHFSWISYLIITFFVASTYKWSLQAVQYTKKDKFDSIVKFLSARFYLKPVIEKGAFW